MLFIFLPEWFVKYDENKQFDSKQSENIYILVVFAIALKGVRFKKAGQLVGGNGDSK